MTSPVGTRTLGRGGLPVSALGLGCMGMSQMYGAADRSESIATIHRALDLGVTFLDTVRRLRRRAQRGAGRRGRSPDAATRCSWPPSSR